MAAQPPDHAKRALLTSLAIAKAHASQIGATLAASLIGMAILSVSLDPSAADDAIVAQNDNVSQPGADA